MQRKHFLLPALPVVFFGACALLPFASQASTTGVLLPNADGTYLQWTPSTGATHYTLVDESACNGTTNYNSTVTTGNRDSYGVSLASLGDGAVISQIAIVPCASRNNNGNGSATLDVFYRFNGTDSSATGSYALSGTTPTDLATTTFASLNLFKTSASTLESGAVFTAGTKGARLSRIATVLTYTLTIPSAPSNMVVTNISSSQNDLSWADNSSNELGFKIYRAQNNGTYSQIATTTINVISYSDTGLTADQAYSYYVSGYNSAGGSNSNTATAYTFGIAPDNVTSTSTGSGTTLTLTHTVSSAADRILFVALRTCCTTGLTPSVSDNEVTMTFIDSKDSLNANNGGTAYMYYLLNPPAGTDNITVSLMTSQSNINATAISYTGVDQTSPIEVERTQAEQIGTGQEYTQSVTTTVAGDWVLMMSVCDGGSTPSPGAGSTQRGSSFNAGIVLDSGGPINPAGSASLGYYDALSNPHFASVMVAFRLSDPFSPTSLVATNISSSRNDLAWTDNSYDELGFKVYRALNSGSYSQVATTTQNTVSYSDTGLTADQTYSYYVSSYTATSQNSSNTVRAITYNTAPADPTSLAVNASRNDDVLTWTDNSTDEDGFKIERSTDGSSFSQIATTSLNLSGSAGYTDAGSSGSLYYYRVRAYNMLGTSGYTNTASNTAFNVIVFDNVTTTSTGSGTTLTLTHTVTSTADRILFVGLRTCCSTGLTPSVTYNGTAMTFIDSVDSLNPNNGGTAYLYYLVDPPSGTHDVLITLSTSQSNINATAVSYTGVDQTSPIDVERTQAEQIGTGQEYTQSVTTTVAGDWVVLAGVCDGSNVSPTPASGSTQRGTFADVGSLVDSGGPINPAGSTSLGFYDNQITNPHFASVTVGFKGF